MSLPPGVNILRDFSNRTYLETGTYRGDSLQMALDAGCFENFRGLEISYEMVRFCKNRFGLYNNNNAHFKIVEGDSATDLATLMNPIDHRCTILLDSHWQLFEGTDKGANPFPLLKELEQIAKHPVKGHTILIDDILYMTHPDITGWTLQEIREAIYAIDPRYEIRLIANPVVNNFLVATLSK